MGNEYNITMKQYNGTDYDILYPETGGGQIALTSDILEKFFNPINNQNLSDVLNFLGNFNLYCWRRRTVTPNVQTIISSQAGSQSFSSGQTIYYGDSFSVDSTTPSKVKLNVSGSISASYNNLSTLYNKFWYASEYGSIPEKVIQYYWCDSGAQIGSINIQAKAVSTFPYYNEGEWEYLFSSNQNQYPKFVISEGYYYDYIGTPYTNLTNGGLSEIGYYRGTGASGSGNPNSVILESTPKAFYIFRAPLGNSGAIKLVESCLIIDNQIFNSNAGVFFSLNNNGISWYSYQNSPEYQYNEVNTYYLYIALK